MVNGSSSPIEVVVDRIPEAGRIELNTSYKTIDLTMPASADIMLSAKTKYGKIRSDFPVYLMHDEKRVEIRNGKGKFPVHVETSHNINIKEK